MAPLLLTYEFAAASAASSGTALRNTSELFLSQPLELLGAGAPWRWLILGLVAIACVGRALAKGLAFADGVLWSILEGSGFGILMGPFMLLLLGGIKGWLPASELAAGAAPEPSVVGLVIGGAAWEELLFRFLLFAAIYQLGRWAFRFLDGESERSRWPAELFALVLSSLAFAAVHLDVVVGWLGVGGETYDFTLFAWRAFAGALLATIARSRGLGVAAWTHAVFNLGLVLGSGPGVFLLTPG
jgi:membrane protease YdiL (CAAX protease family)